MVETATPGSDMQLMTGEQDRFHPRSPIESIRKTTLTPFGKLTVEPPVRTPDTEAAQRALDNDGFAYLNVSISDADTIIIPSYPFDFEQDIDALRSLYDTHGLDEVIGNAESDLDKLAALMKYTYSFMEGGAVPTGELWWRNGPSADVITEFRRERGIGGTHEQYSALFCQLALSCGYSARIVGMHTVDEDGTILNHSVCEVFLRGVDKWAVFDPYSRATYYLRDDEPLSALELRDLMFENLYRAIQPVIGAGDLTEVRDVREELLPRYRYLYYWRMNNILSRSRADELSWQALWEYHLVWEDSMAPVSEGAFDRVTQFSNTDDPTHPLRGVRFVTHDEQDFDWPLYHFQVHIHRTAVNVIEYFMDTLTPNFSHFQIDSAGTANVYDNIHTLEMLNQEVVIKVYDAFGTARSGTLIIYQ